MDTIKNIPNVESEQPNVLKTFTTFLELSSSDSNSHSDSDRREERKEESKEERNMILPQYDLCLTLILNFFYIN